MAEIASRSQWLPKLSTDGWLLFATCAVRTFAYGLALFAVFRKVRPPEELARQEHAEQEHAEEGNHEVGHA